MTVEATMVDVLLANATVAGYVGTGIYPVVIRQNTTAAAITYRRIYGEREYSLAGATENAQITVDLTAWATSYPTARAIATSIRKALNGYIGNGASDMQFVMLRDGADIWDDDSQMYGCPVEITVMATED